MFGSLDFLRIRRADRRQAIGIHQPALQQAYLAEIFDTVHGVERLVQIRQRKRTWWKHALINHVVHREHRARRQLHTAALLGIAQQQRQESRLPVVRVQNIETSTRGPHDLDHRLLKKNETRIVVVVFAFTGPIKLSPVKKFLPHHKLQRQPGPHRERMHLAYEIPAAHANFQRLGMFRILHQRRLQNRPVAGDDHRDLMPASGQRRAERSDHVREPAGLDIGKHLAGRVNNSHVATLRLVLHGSSRICKCYQTANESEGKRTGTKALPVRVNLLMIFPQDTSCLLQISVR